MRPRPRYRPPVAVAVALALLGGAPGHTAEVVDAWSVQKAANAAAAEADRFKTLADRQATDELVDAIKSMQSSAVKGSLAYEQLLDRGLLELARTPPTAAARALVQESARLQPQIYVRIDPDHGSRAAPLYDPGATARFVLQTWARREARDAALSALRAGQHWPVERYAQKNAPAEGDPAQAGVVDAFQQLAPRALANVRDALASALRAGQRVDELAMIAAERLRDRDLFALVFAHADAAVAVRAIASAARSLNGAEQFEALRAAAMRPELASAATLQIGRLAGDDANARTHLFEALSDPDVGDSAAAALATLHDAGAAAELGRRLRDEPREPTRRRLALALQLDGSPAARAELTRFVQGRSGSAQLRKDVSAWLAQ